MSILEYFPEIADVRDSYRRFREKGFDRAEAIRKTREEYARELADSDDGPQVRIALADVTGRRKEMTLELMQEAEAAFAALETSFPEAKSAIRAKKKTVCDPSKLGPEAAYRKKNAYWPPWQIGDTFAYRLSGKPAKEKGLEGWFVICRKAHEFVYSEDCHVQGMYYSLCRPGAIPQTTEELERLGYVPLMQTASDCYLFMGQLWVTSRSDEKKTYFRKIGCFPDVAPPANEYSVTDDGPHICMGQLPLYNKDDCFWHLEIHILDGYGKYGIMPSVRYASPPF